MEWIMYTVGTVAHLWALLTVVALFAVGRDSVTRRINISAWRLFTPWIMVLAYWNWHFFG